MLPAWYFGNSYRDPARCVMVMHIIPINYLVRAGRQIQHWWNRYRTKPTWLDKKAFEIEAEMNKRLNKNIGIKIRAEANRLLEEVFKEERKARGEK